jgi:hypothetical protein
MTTQDIIVITEEMEALWSAQLTARAEGRFSAALKSVSRIVVLARLAKPHVAKRKGRSIGDLAARVHAYIKERGSVVQPHAPIRTRKDAANVLFQHGLNVQSVQQVLDVNRKFAHVLHHRYRKARREKLATELFAAAHP